MKNIETSKLVLALVLIIGFIFLVAILIGWLVFDRMDAAGFAGVIVGPMATTIGFYLWKAKNENISKYSKKEAEKIIGFQASMVSSESEEEIAG